MEMSHQILVVDDSLLMRRMMIASVRAAGVSRVVEAVDGLDGEEKFYRGDFDLVLSDLNMPHKTGLEFVRSIRENGSDTKVIMVTSEKDCEAEAIQLGVTEFVPKPFQIASLSQVIRSQLRELRADRLFSGPAATPVRNRRAS